MLSERDEDEMPLLDHCNADRIMRQLFLIDRILPFCSGIGVVHYCEALDAVSDFGFMNRWPKEEVAGTLKELGFAMEASSPRSFIEVLSSDPVRRGP